MSLPTQPCYDGTFPPPCVQSGPRCSPPGRQGAQYRSAQRLMQSPRWEVGGALSPPSMGAWPQRRPMSGSVAA